jgi:chromate transporter
LLRALCVEKNQWIDADEFEHAITATNLLPGPASTQLAIYCAWRLRGRLGGFVGGLCFIAPGLVFILALGALFLSSHPPLWILGLAMGAGAAVPVVALRTAVQLGLPSWRRASAENSVRPRWIFYAALGAACAAAFAPYLVLVILGAGLLETAWRVKAHDAKSRASALVPSALAHVGIGGGVGALAWVSLKVGALSYGGGLVIVPLMEHDVVTTYHWMTGAQFLNAVALGQVTPGPVVLTVAVVGYAAKGLVGALLGAGIVFAPSFLFVLVGAPRFERLRSNRTATSFLAGAGPCVIGAIAGSSLPLALLLSRLWQLPVLLGALVWLFVARRNVVGGLLLAAAAGAIIVLARGHV